MRIRKYFFRQFFVLTGSESIRGSRVYEVRQKGGVDKNRILNHPNFQRTRENMQEFGTAASKTKHMRQQFNNVSRGVADKTM